MHRGARQCNVQYKGRERKPKTGDATPLARGTRDAEPIRVVQVEMRIDLK
jgi:hypothetical protein